LRSAGSTAGDAGDRLSSQRLTRSVWTSHCRIPPGLREVGYFEGRNISIEYRGPRVNFDRLPALAADLVQRRVAAIGAFGGNAAPNAAKGVTLDIPNRL